MFSEFIFNDKLINKKAANIAAYIYLGQALLI